MRCIICDVKLDDFEVLRKYPKNHPRAGEHLDTCTKCLVHIMDSTNFVPDFNNNSWADSEGLLFDPITGAAKNQGEDQEW